MVSAPAPPVIVSSFGVVDVAEWLYPPISKLSEASPLIMSLYCVPATFSTFLTMVVEEELPIFPKEPFAELFSVMLIPLELLEKSIVSVLSPPSII